MNFAFGDKALITQFINLRLQGLNPEHIIYVPWVFSESQSS